MEGEYLNGSFDALPVESPYPGVERTSFDATGATVTRYRFGADASFPLHSHDQEQITVILDGSVTFVVGGQEQRLGVGEWSVVPQGVEHGLRAGNHGAVFLAVIAPRRHHALDYTVSGTAA